MIWYILLALLAAVGIYALVKLRTSVSAEPRRDGPRPAQPPVPEAIPPASPPLAASEPTPTDADEKGIALVDLETTGLDPVTDRIIEIALLIFKPGDSDATIQSALINPGGPVPSRITSLTGITNEMLSTAEPASVVLPRFFGYIGQRTICSYNVKFDSQFLQEEAARLGITLTNKVYCIMEAAQETYPGLPSYKLQSVCDSLGVTCDSPAHRASGDVERALRVLLAMRHGKKPNGAAAVAVAVESDLISQRSGKAVVPSLDLGWHHAEILGNWPSGEWGALWTRPTYGFINIYAPGSVGGSGLLARIAKDNNPEFEELFNSEKDIGVRVVKSDSSYVVQFSSD